VVIVWVVIWTIPSWAFQGLFAVLGIAATPALLTDPTPLLRHLLWLSPLVLVVSIVGIYVSLGLSFVLTDCAAHPEVSIGRGVARSWRMADGFRWWLLLAGLVAIPVCLAGALACCVGLVPALALQLTFMTAIYLALAPRDLAIAPPQ
jgi:hypothetical protein